MADQESVRAAIAGDVEAMVSGPITGGRHGWPFRCFLGGVERFGYVEEEYFLEGEAVRFAPVGLLEKDGKWTVAASDPAPFRTRLIVQRPSDPTRFNGIVFVEWINVSAGHDHITSHAEMFKTGSAFVFASVQKVSIDGLAPVPMGLKAWDPERYGTLDHPGESYSYDMFSQVALAVGPGRSRAGIDPMQGLEVRKLVAMGASQSAFRLTSYANAIHKQTNIFDAFLLAVSFGAGSPFDDSVLNISEVPLSPYPVIPWPPVRIRDDLDVPMMIVNSETEALAYYPSRQDDTDGFRFWEMAGAGHFALPAMEPLGKLFTRDFGPQPTAWVMEALSSPSHISWEPTFLAAVRHVERWITEGVPPPIQPRIEIAENPVHIMRDEHGIALGGIRLPQVVVPVACNEGAGYGLEGRSTPFTAEQLHALYPNHRAYVEKASIAAQQALDAGVILKTAADQYLAAAMTRPEQKS